MHKDHTLLHVLQYSMRGTNQFLSLFAQNMISLHKIKDFGSSYLGRPKQTGRFPNSFISLLLSNLLKNEDRLGPWCDSDEI